MLHLVQEYMRIRARFLEFEGSMAHLGMVFSGVLQPRLVCTLANFDEYSGAELFSKTTLLIQFQCLGGQYSCHQLSITNHQETVSPVLDESTP